MPTNKNKKEKRDKKSKKSKRKDAIQMLMEVLPQLCDSDSSDNEAERQQPASRQKNSQRDKSNLRRTNFANGLLGEANPSKARAKDIPGIPTIPNLWQAEDAYMDEWRRNNSCFLDMHVGHAEGPQALAKGVGRAVAGEGNRNREAWNAVRNIAPFKKPEDIATTFSMDI